MFNRQNLLPIAQELIVDLFAGGGGWSTGFEMATGQHPHIAINHDADAISMHEANHPQTRHYHSDVFEVCPREATEGMPVGWLHLSPDCTHHSQAKGGQPRDRRIRALAWIGVRWAGQTAPRIISLENVKQILKWGPLVAKRCPDTGRVVTLDMVPDATGRMVNRVADPGERVPVHRQFLVPCKKREGKTWKRFVAILRGMGYAVEWRRLNAADYDAPTSRDRLFMLARRDGQPIVWPAPTRAAAPAPKTRLKKYVPAAEAIDFSNEGNSIFERPKPLAPATLRRIARGVKRYVLDSADPFIVPLTHQGADRVHDIREPLRTITGANRGELALASPVLIQAGYGEREGQAPRCLDLQQPLGTVTAGGIKHALAMPVMIQASHGEGKPDGVKRWGLGAKDVREPLGTITTSGSGGQAVATAYLAQMNGGFNETPGHDVRKPMTTITNSGSQQQLVTAHLAHLRGNCDARDITEPLHTISAGGLHHAAVTSFLEQCGQGADAGLSDEDQERAMNVAAFLIRYYGEGGQLGDPREPMATITTKDRLALVTVYVRGTPYVIVDIKLRMLEPRELYKAQGFPSTYNITSGHDGRRFSKSAQVRMCGNSVSPLPAMHLVKANWTRPAMLQAA